MKQVSLVLIVILSVCFANSCKKSKINESDDNLDPNEVTNVIGWSEPVPTPFDISSYPLSDIQQPGSRLIYISNEGNDSSGELYFWDGTNIVDIEGSTTGEGGVVYGTDPMNPSGPIKPYRRWAYVAHRYQADDDIGTPWDGTPYQIPGGYEPQTRYEYPDWWLFKRGETFDINEDFLSFGQESNPGLSGVERGSLAVSGGRSSSERQIVGAWGDLSQARPRFINPTGGAFISRTGNPDPKHILYLSLHFDGRGTRTGYGFNFNNQGSGAIDITLEDCWSDGTSGNIVQNTSIQLTLRRCIITDSHASNGDHLQGVFFYGNRDAQLRIEECILMRNGFSHGDPEVTGWPPSGEQYYDIYNRNLYLSGECDNMNSGVFNTVSLIGASGDQIRPGMRVEGNFFYQGYVEMGAFGGYPDSDGPTGSMLDNVQQRFYALGTDDNRGHPGLGLRLTSGSYQVEVARNIVTNAQHERDRYGFLLEALHWYCYCHTFKYPTRENNIHDNIFESSNATAAISVVDGVEGNDAGCANWSNRGVSENEISGNILINGNNSDYEYNPVGDAIGLTDNTIFTNNTIYPNSSDAAAAEGWGDPNRTLKDYMISLGHSVSSDDGFIEYFNLAKQMRKGSWNTDLTSNSIVNYIRNGYGMSNL